MKKALISCLLIASSAFFAYAQLDLGGVKVNVGTTCWTIKGKRGCINPATGQWEQQTGNGNVIGGNTNTGQIGGTGSIGGVRFGGMFGGTSGTGMGGGFGSTAGGNALMSLLGMLQVLVVRAVPLLIGVALLAFFWYLIVFIWKASDNPEEQKKTKKGMFWSIVALFCMVSVWGLVGFIGSMLGINQGSSISGFKLPGEQ